MIKCCVCLIAFCLNNIKALNSDSDNTSIGLYEGQAVLPRQSDLSDLMARMELDIDMQGIVGSKDHWLHFLNRIGKCFRRIPKAVSLDAILVGLDNFRETGEFYVNADNGKVNGLSYAIDSLLNKIETANHAIIERMNIPMKMQTGLKGKNRNLMSKNVFKTTVAAHDILRGIKYCNGNQVIDMIRRAGELMISDTDRFDDIVKFGDVNVANIGHYWLEISDSLTPDLVLQISKQITLDDIFFDLEMNF